MLLADEVAQAIAVERHHRCLGSGRARGIENLAIKGKNRGLLCRA